MKRLVVGTLVSLALAPSASATPRLDEHQAVRWMERNCAEVDGVDRYLVRRVQRASPTVVHLRVTGVFTEGEFDEWDVTTTITVKLRRGRLVGWNGLFGWY